MTHATTLDIQAILTARRAQLEASLAAARAAAVRPVPSIGTQSIQVPGPVPTPAAAPIVTDADLTVFIQKNIPVLVTAVQTAVKGGFHVASVIDLIQLVSTLVRDGLPQAKGADARSIVIAVFSGVVQTYLTPLLPSYLRLFVPGMIQMAVSGLESIYQAHVRK